MFYALLIIHLKSFFISLHILRASERVEVGAINLGGLTSLFFFMAGTNVNFFILETHLIILIIFKNLFFYLFTYHISLSFSFFCCFYACFAFNPIPAGKI